MNILALPALALALALNGAPPPAVESISFQAEPSRDISTRELSVLTYNVRGLPWPIARGRKEALAAIGRELAEMRRQGRAPDIVLIQEGFEDVSELVRLSGYPYWAPGPSKADSPGRGIASRGFARVRYLAMGEGWGKFTSAGLHVLSEHPLMEVESAPYRYCAGLDCLANKGAMMVRVEVPGLPEPLEVVNTHMNSRSAAKVPWSRSLKAHNLQSEELVRFVERAHTPGAPLLVGGDFNVKGAPDRYYFKAAERPFVVVSEYCKATQSQCRSDRPLDMPEPWLASQDLQAFGRDGAVEIRPLEIAHLFAGGDTGEALSDHDGVLVRYRLSWREGEDGRRIVADLR